MLKFINEREQAVVTWLTDWYHFPKSGENRNTGLSSLAMVYYVFSGVEPQKSSYPGDLSDFQACVRCYDSAPTAVKNQMVPILQKYKQYLIEKYDYAPCDQKLNFSVIEEPVPAQESPQGKPVRLKQYAQWLATDCAFSIPKEAYFSSTGLVVLPTLDGKTYILNRDTVVLRDDAGGLTAISRKEFHDLYEVITE